MRKSLIWSGLFVLAGAMGMYFLGEERTTATSAGVSAETKIVTLIPNGQGTDPTAPKASGGDSGKTETSESTVDERPKDEQLAKPQVVLEPDQLITPPELAIGGEPPQPRQFNLKARGDGAYSSSVSASSDAVLEPRIFSASVISTAVLPNVPDRLSTLRAKVEPAPRLAVQQARENRFADQLERHPERAELQRLRRRLEQ